MRVFLALIALFSFTNLSAQVFSTADEIQPLESGTAIPSIAVSSIEGEQILISDLVKQKHAVVIFYRGGWCPYCNTHLAAIASIEEKIRNYGYQIIGISPDSPEVLKNSIAKNDLNYKLYSDSSTLLIQAMGIAIEAPERYSSMLMEHSADQNSHVIPVPAAFIVNSQGKIIYTYTNANYKERISEEELLRILSNSMK